MVAAEQFEVLGVEQGSVVRLLVPDIDHTLESLHQ